MTTYSLTINGRERRIDAPADKPLLWVLREDLRLTGAKFGCGIGACGACTVHVDGNPTRSCITGIADVAGQDIVTVEGLAAEGLHAIQRAWIEEEVPQCGYCQSGQIMSAAALLATVPNPGDGDIDGYMSGNLCRCGSYNRIRRAIKRAAELKTEEAGETA